MKHEFRFVVEGVDLDPEQVAAIEVAIREAGLVAIGRTTRDDLGFVSVNPRMVFDRIKWRGYWILGDKIAQEAINQAAQQNPKSLR